MEPITTPGDAIDQARRKLEIDEKRLQVEFDKIKIEKLRAWTGSISTFASLLVVAGTIALGIWSQYQQAKLQHDIQERQAKAQFELKAAEIVMSTDNPEVTLNKARAIQSLFPHYLSTNFAESFVPKSFARPEEADKIELATIRKPVAENKPLRQTTQQLGYGAGGRPPRYRARPIQPVDPYDPAEGEDNAGTVQKGLAYRKRPVKEPKPAGPTPSPTPAQ